MKELPFNTVGFQSRKKNKSWNCQHGNYVCEIKQRGFNIFSVEDKQIKVDTKDFSKINTENIFSQITA